MSPHHSISQFVGLETISSGISDLFPGQMRQPWRREMFLAVFCLVSFLLQILLVTEARTIHRPISQRF